MENAERVVVAVEIDLRNAARGVVAFAQVVACGIEVAVHVAVAETHAQTVVVAVEIADEGFDGGHRAVGVDAVEDEHDVRVVARHRAVYRIRGFF